MEDKLTRLICDLEVDSGSGSSNAQAASPARLLAKRLLEDGKVSRHPYSLLKTKYICRMYARAREQQRRRTRCQGDCLDWQVR